METIQYFVKGQRVKPNEYYKFRSEISNKVRKVVPHLSPKKKRQR